MKSIINCIFISIIMHPNFMHFRQKISLKNALESFASVSGHLRTALSLLHIVNAKIIRMTILKIGVT